MRVRMNAQITGTRNGAYWPPRGGELDLPDIEAAKLCASGMASEVVPVEAAIAPEVETATVSTTPRARKPRG